MESFYDTTGAKLCLDGDRINAIGFKEPHEADPTGELFEHQVAATEVDQQIEMLSDLLFARGLEPLVHLAVFGAGWRQYAVQIGLVARFIQIDG